jgi:hypothetical protein
VVQENRVGAKGEGVPTMPPHFEELLRRTPEDGAAVQSVAESSGRIELTSDLLDAWQAERHARIETGLFLEEARRLLRVIVQTGDVTPDSRRRAGRLLRAIRDARPDSTD